jgi:intraflagellar transport protein 140
MDINGDHIVVWSGKKVEIYEITDGTVLFLLVFFFSPPLVFSIPLTSQEKDTNFQHLSTFKSPALAATVHNDSVFVALPLRIEICNFQGICKQTISFMETEGDPLILNISGNFLVAITKNNYLKCWDLSRREARLHGSGRKFDEQG